MDSNGARCTAKERIVPHNIHTIQFLNATLAIHVGTMVRPYTNKIVLASPNSFYSSIHHTSTFLFSNTTSMKLLLMIFLKIQMFIISKYKHLLYCLLV